MLKAIGLIFVTAAISGCYDASARKSPEERFVENAALQQRVNDWAYVVRTKQLSPTEELSVVVVPSQMNATTDTRCLIYKNREFQTVTFTCPHAHRDDSE